MSNAEPGRDSTPDRIVISSGGERQLVERSGFLKELELQDLIEKSPELLGALGGGLTFVPVGREVPVGSGFVDLLFLDSEGVPTLVETKLRTNPESRRQVIGQISGSST